jgi:hypothetical protein
LKHELTASHNLVFHVVPGWWRLQIWVERAENITNKVFVWQRLPDAPFQSPGRNIFANVAQPADLVEYPEDEPGPDHNFFRLGYMDLTLDSFELAQETIAKTASDLGDLCKAMDDIE